MGRGMAQLRSKWTENKRSSRAFTMLLAVLRGNFSPSIRCSLILRGKKFYNSLQN